MADEEGRALQERYAERDRLTRRRFGFDQCCDRAFDRLKQAWSAHVRGDAVDARALADDLGHGIVPAAFVHDHADVPGSVATFATALADTTSGRHRAPAIALLGFAQLQAGEAHEALTSLDAAVRADPGLVYAAGTLALLELDRGNLARAHTLAVLDAADAGVVEWIEAERSRRAALRPTAGRNDPCPCGSGKKFKHCCANASTLTLAQRSPFVLQRLAHFATGPEGHDTMIGLALSAAGDVDDVAEALRRFVQDPFLVDVAVHEGGLGQAYLDQRGALLPDDEVDLLAAVLSAPRRLWEIAAVEAGRSMTLRDTGSGDVATVLERAGTQDREPGELLFARVALAGDVTMLFGVPLLVPLRERARVLRLVDDGADADDLASWFGSLFLPPRLANREGEDMVLRRTVLEVVDYDTDAVAAALDETFERADDDDELVWHETTLVDGHDRVVRGTVRLDGMLITVESNSEERQERLLATLDDLLDYTLLADDELDLEDLDDLDGGPLDGREPGEVPEEVRALIAEKIAEYEQRWVDESIPALGGLTPRQVIDDPTRREDLTALLREMRATPVPAGAAGMSADRLAQLLGLDLPH